MEQKQIEHFECYSDLQLLAFFKLADYGKH